MDAGWLLTGGLAGVGGLAGFAWHEIRRGRGDGASIDPDPQAVGDPDAESSPSAVAYRKALALALQHPPRGGVQARALAAQHGVAPIAAALVCRRLYRRFARQVADDGVITPKERTKLDGLAQTLDIPPLVARAIEDEANLEVYRADLEVAHEDGVITPDEADHLDRLRQSLGITHAMASALDKPVPDQRPPTRRFRFVGTGSSVGVVVALLLLMLNRPALPVVVEQAQTSMAASNPNAVSEVPLAEVPTTVVASAPVKPAVSELAGNGVSTEAEADRPSTDTSLAIAPTQPTTSAIRLNVVIPRTTTTSSPAATTNLGYSNPGFTMPSFSRASRSSSSNGPVHVRAYTRKDGTHVQAHTRSAPRSTPRSSSRSSSSSGRSSGGGRRR